MNFALREEIDVSLDDVVVTERAVGVADTVVREEEPDRTDVVVP